MVLLEKAGSKRRKIGLKRKGAVGRRVRGKGLT